MFKKKKTRRPRNREVPRSIQMHANQNGTTHKYLYILKVSSVQHMQPMRTISSVLESSYQALSIRRIMSLFAQLFTNQLDQKRVYNIVADGAESGSRARISHDVSFWPKYNMTTIRSSLQADSFLLHCHRQKNNKKHSSGKALAKKRSV